MSIVNARKALSDGLAGTATVRSLTMQYVRVPPGPQRQQFTAKVAKTDGSVFTITGTFDAQTDAHVCAYAMASAFVNNAPSDEVSISAEG